MGRSFLHKTAIAAALLMAMPASAGASSLLDYVGQCVPFARAASGIQIFGDAWTWWDKASDKRSAAATATPT
jgi:hypothetical protein